MPIQDMEKVRYCDEITQALRGEKVGLSQRKLSEKIQASRPTVKKYCEVLLEKDVISVEKISGSHVYYLNDGDDSEL
jgi:response regulator of citrate/malate metabolism